jgi:sulfate permease, SulP family
MRAARLSSRLYSNLAGANILSASQHPWLSNARNEAVGGLVSAAVAIPLAMGFGMFAFVSLGDEYFANGARAGLYTAFIVAIVCVVLGDKTANVYAPRITSTFFLGVLLYNLVHSGGPMSAPENLSLALATFFSIVLVGGVFQLAFGLVKLGTLIKFAPHPVMAGFQNAAALLLFLVQLGSVFGFDKSVRFTFALRHVDQAKPLSLAVAAVTFAAMWNSRKFLAKVPPVVVGLLVGTGLYYVLVLAGFARNLGPIIGSVPFTAFGMFPDFAGLGRNPDLAAMLPTILSGALALAIIASIDALLCAKLLTRPGDAKVDGNRLLARLGVGNMFAAGFGGITSGLNLGPSLTNRALGARAPLSVLVNAVVILLAFSVLFGLVVHVPRVALSAVIMVVAVQHLDPWSLRLFRQFASGSAAYRRNVAPELFVVLAVAVLSIALDIVVAVFLGVAFAVVLFLVRMSRSVVRRMYRCDAIRSRKSRTAQETQTLERRGGAILVMELQGALFFGTAEKLANDIAAQLLQDTRCVILDLRRVTEIDSTGSQILADVHAELISKGQRLLVSRAREVEASARLTDFGFLEAVTKDNVFQDIDRAIEAAEDDLLRDELAGGGFDQEIPLERISVVSGFGPEEVAAIRSHLARAVYPAGSVVFREGDPGEEVFLIAKGTASAYLPQADGGDIRLMTFASGTVFGELAILDRGARSASVVADTELVCYVLGVKEFAALSAGAPAAAIKLLANLGRELSARLRRANRTIHQLEM